MEERLYSFLDEFATATKQDVSELCRNVITYFFMSYLLGETKPAGLTARFFAKYGRKNKKVRK
jgi:hypothetical protein